MILTQKQEIGLATAVARYKAHEAYTCISGYALLDMFVEQ